jgi:hypothetical protein
VQILPIIKASFKFLPITPVPPAQLAYAVFKAKKK